MKRNIIVLNLGLALLWMAMYSYVPTLPAYSMSLGATAAMVGMIGGAYGVMQIILRIPLGIVSDKLGKDKLLILIGFIILTISTIIFLTVDDVYGVLIARGVSGIAAAWAVVVCAVYAKCNAEENQVKGQGILNASSSMGKVFAALLGGLAAQAFGLRGPLVLSFFVAIAGICCVMMLKMPKQTQKVTPPSGRELLSLLKNKELIIFSVLAVFAQITCFALPSYFASVAAENLGADSASMGGLMLVYFLFTGLSSLLVGTRVYRKIGGIKCVAISFAVSAFTCIPMFYHVDLMTIYIMQAVSGIGYGVATGALSGYVIKSVEPRYRATAVGIFQSIFAIGIFAGPVIMGAVIEAVSFDAAFWVILAQTALAAILSMVLIPKKYDKI